MKKVEWFDGGVSKDEINEYLLDVERIEVEMTDEEQAAELARVKRATDGYRAFLASQEPAPSPAEAVPQAEPLRPGAEGR